MKTRPMMRLTTLLWLLAVVLGTADSPRAQQKAEGTLYTRVEGDVVRAAIEIAIEPDWHLYHDDLGHADAVGRPTVVELSGGGIAWSQVVFPEPEFLEQPGMMPDGSDGWINGHGDEIVIYAAGRVPEGELTAEITAEISGLTCLDGGSCIPYRETLTSQGEGPEVVFLDFPEDLQAPAAGAGVQDEFSGEAAVGGRATFRMYTRFDDESRVLQVAVEAQIDDHWHLYHDDIGDPGGAAKPTIVTLKGDGVLGGQALFPEPETLLQPGLAPDGGDAWVNGHHDTIWIRAAAKLAAGVSASDVEVEIDGLTCEDGGSCIPFVVTLTSMGAGPDEAFEDFPAELAPEGEPLASGSADSDAGADSSADSSAGSAALNERGANDVEAWAALASTWDYQPRERGIGTSGESKSLLLWMVLAFIAGSILNVMPCVLPVVSIKILSFVNQAGESRGRIFALGLAFGAGILSVFLVLGALAALLGLGWGQQFQSATFLVIMTSVVFAFALSLFGVFEIGLPNAVGQMAGTQKQEGLLGAFSMGILSTILATPCSGPFLGSTLAWAVTQPKLTIMAIFGMAGFGMAAPYLVLTSNPKFLKYVPKPGAWMETFKHVSGFLLLFTAIFLLASVPDSLLRYTILFLVFTALGCWIWGRFATFDQTRAKHAATLAIAIATVGLGGWFSFRMLPAFLHIDEAVWEPFDAHKLATYQAQGRNVFIDWTADWCLTCKTNERVVFHAESIQELFSKKGFALMIADETEVDLRQKIMEDLRVHLGSTSIPFCAVFPGDEPQAPYTFRDLVTREAFSEVLELCPDPAALEFASR